EPSLRSTFRDCIALEQQAISSPEARGFWSGFLSGVSETSIPNPEPGEGTGVEHVIVNRYTERSHELQAIAKRAQSSLKSVFLAIHACALSILTGQREIVTGLVSNGRLEALDTEKVVGLFLNTLPLRCSLEGGSWLDLIRHARDEERRLWPYRHYPLP